MGLSLVISSSLCVTLTLFTLFRGLGSGPGAKTVASILIRLRFCFVNPRETQSERRSYVGISFYTQQGAPLFRKQANQQPRSRIVLRSNVWVFPNVVLSFMFPTPTPALIASPRGPHSSAASQQVPPSSSSSSSCSNMVVVTSHYTVYRPTPTLNPCISCVCLVK